MSSSVTAVSPSVMRACREKDRDAARTLERVRVHVRVFMVDAAEIADRARAVEQRLGQRRLSGVDVRQDPQNQLLHKHLVNLQR